MYSQQSAEARLERSIKTDLSPTESEVIGKEPLIGVIPRLDVIARFLGERGSKITRAEFTKRTSSQPTVDECLRRIAQEVLNRVKRFHA